MTTEQFIKANTNKAIRDDIEYYLGLWFDSVESYIEAVEDARKSTAAKASDIAFLLKSEILNFDDLIPNQIARFKKDMEELLKKYEEDFKLI